MTNLETFPLVLRQYRRAADLTQEQLAELVGCAVATLRAFESGRRRPSRDLAERLAAVLEVPTAMQERFIRLARQSGPGDEADDETGREVTPLPSVHIRTRAQMPPPATQLIGRQRERAQVIELLQNPQVRLVTLLGPGGVGKTSLSLQIGRDLESTFADGAAFVGLGPLSAVEHVPAAIADVLGCMLSGVAPPEVDLAAFLREREMLLVLDNLEHLLVGDKSERLIGLLRRLLEQAPRLRILATSRERLRMRDEWIVELDGLDLPDMPGRAAIEQSDAVLLFVSRARQIGGDFVLTAENRQAVAQLCRTLEGMPLGIELAAAWVNVLSCSEIAQEISRNQELLTSNARDIPLRHRSLRAVFDHSWGLLNADERRTLRRLSIFRGRFSREAATMVLSDSLHQQRSSIHTLPLLASLVDKSLLRIRSDQEGQSFYEMHEQIRQYGAGRLAESSEEEALARELHATYYAGWVEQQHMQLKSAAQRQTTIAINRAVDNIRLAWQWAVEHRQAALMLQIIHTFGWFCEVQGRNPECAQMFAQGADALEVIALQQDAAAIDQVVYWLLRSLEGWNSVRFDLPRAIQLFQSALDPLRRHDNHRALFHALIGPAYLATFSGQQESARLLLDESLAAARRGDYFWGEATVLVVLAVLEVLYSDSETAQQQLRTSLQAARQCGDPRHVALMLNYNGLIELRLNNLDMAEALCREALSIGMEQRDRYQIGLGMLHLGQIALARRDEQSATWLLREALAVARENSDYWLEAQVLGAQGQLAAITDTQQGITLLRQGLKASVAGPPIVGLDLLVDLAEYAYPQAPVAALTALQYVAGHPLARPAIRTRAEALFKEGSAQQDAEMVAKAITGVAAYRDQPPQVLGQMFADL